MNDKEQRQDSKTSDVYGNRGQGMQGIDKAPGEETNTDNVQFSNEALKGKKVDADPSKQEDKPLDNQGFDA